MKIKFKNSKELDYLKAIEAEEYYNGSSRRTLTFECDTSTISIDELNEVLSVEDNLKEITLINDQIPMTILESEYLLQGPQPFSNIYDGYVLKLKCGVESVLIENESPETPAKYEDRIIFKLGKRTYIEEQLNKLGL